ncbi:type II secretion system F family protein [Photobacterium sp. R1]
MMKLSVQLRYFFWRGRHQNGQRTQGLAAAYDPEEIVQRLKAEKITLLAMRRRRPGWLTRRRHDLRQQDLTQLLRQLSLLLHASLPLSSALTLLAREQSRMAPAALLRRLGTQVASGRPLSDALADSLPFPDTTLCSLLTAGEQAGQLPQMLAQIATYREQSQALQRNLKQALVYPAAVCLVAAAVTTLMLAWVIPQFASLFASMGNQLPWLTRTVLALSDRFREIGLPAVTALVFLIGCSRLLYQRSPLWQARIHRYGLRCPLLGPLWQLAAQARFTRTLGITFQAGLPLLSGLKLASATCGNRALEQAYRQASRQVSAGQPLHQALRQQACVSDRLVHMVMVGEETGQLDTLLLRLADQDDSALSHQLKTLTTLTEPLLILLIGALVGTLLLAMYLPVFDLMKVVG